MKNAESAMNTIPLTFNEHQIKRTVLGGTQTMQGFKMNVSVIMINDSGIQSYVQTVKRLISCGFKSIVWAEPSKYNFNIEGISRQFPTVKFVVPLEESTLGELINLCVEEIDTEYFLVVRGCIKITSNLLLQNIAENLMRAKKYCIVPRLIDKNNQSIPVHFIPESNKGHFLLSEHSFIMDGISTLHTTDFIGFFNREKFIRLGGYDYRIISPYWQNADLSLRAWLWGEQIEISTALMFAYDIEREIPDITRDYSYLHFYVKNILPKFKEDHGFVPSSSFLNFKLHSACGFFEGLALFKDAEHWVNINKYRFKTDAQGLIEDWMKKK